MRWGAGSCPALWPVGCRAGARRSVPKLSAATRPRRGWKRARPPGATCTTRCDRSGSRSGTRSARRSSKAPGSTANAIGWRARRPNSTRSMPCSPPPGPACRRRVRPAATVASSSRAPAGRAARCPTIRYSMRSTVWRTRPPCCVRSMTSGCDGRAQRRWPRSVNRCAAGCAPIGPSPGTTCRSSWITRSGAPAGRVWRRGSATSCRARSSTSTRIRTRSRPESSAASMRTPDRRRPPRPSSPRAASRANTVLRRRRSRRGR